MLPLAATPNLCKSIAAVGGSAAIVLLGESNDDIIALIVLTSLVSTCVCRLVRCDFQRAWNANCHWNRASKLERIGEVVELVISSEALLNSQRS